jgi:SNF2 family DNA or RNA helicase
LKQGVDKMQLYEHQKQALSMTKTHNRVGYFLDMGLGKTFVGSEKMYELDALYNLVVCQKSKVQDWVDHFNENYDGDYLVLNLTEKKDSAVFQSIMEGNAGVLSETYVVGVINYDLLFRRSYIAHISGFTLLLDESQMIRNETAKRSKAVLKMTPENVILLSGTPSAGKYEKLWSQCKLLGWDITKKAYWNSYIDTEWVEDGNTGFKREQVVGYKNTERLKRKLADHGAVFMKTEDVFDLPEQQEIKIRIDASKEYKKFMKNSIITMNSLTLCEAKDESPQNVKLIGDVVLTKFLYARQLCGQYSKEKLNAFSDLLESAGDRLIVFYNFTAELVQLVQIANAQERPISIVNGQQKDLTAYEDQEDAVIFVQYQAGAMGLNLQKANKTVYFSLPFGKGSCDLWQQSKKRTHRIGQLNKCLYYYLICKGTIEEKNLINLRLGKEYDDYLFEKECT